MAIGCGSSLRTSSARVRPRLVRRSRMVRTPSIASSRRSRATMSFSTSSVFSSIAFLSSVNSSSDRRRVRRRVLLLLMIRTFSCALPVRILRRQVYLAGAVSSFSLEFVSRRPTSALRNRKADETRAETEETGSRVFHQPTAPRQLAQRHSSRSCSSSLVELTYNLVGATKRAVNTGRRPALSVPKLSPSPIGT